MSQVFHIVPTKIAVLMSSDPHLRFACSCKKCTAVTTIYLGRVVEFYNGKEPEYHIFCSDEHVLLALPVECMNQA